MFRDGKNFKRFTLDVGDRIEFKTSSTLLRGTYFSRVLEFNTRLGIVHISFPTSDGKLVLVPVGTNIKIRLAGTKNWLEKFTVIDRTSGENRCLVLQVAFHSANQLVNYQPPKGVKILSVSSGKGGVGKTTFAINLAVALGRQGKRVCIVDAALGTANVDVLLGITARYNLAHVIAGRCKLTDILLESNYGVHIVPGCSGLQKITEMSDFEYSHLAQEFDRLCEYMDVIIIDTSSGVSRNVTNFVMAAKQGYLIITPEPSSVTDAYALLKTLVKEHDSVVDLGLVVNRATSKQEALEAAERIQFAAERFLDLELRYSGFILEDRKIRESIMMQMPVLKLAPNSMASQGYLKIAAGPEQIAKKETNCFSNVITRLKNIVKKA